MANLSNMYRSSCFEPQRFSSPKLSISISNFSWRESAESVVQFCLLQRIQVLRDCSICSYTESRLQFASQRGKGDTRSVIGTSLGNGLRAGFALCHKDKLLLVSCHTTFPWTAIWLLCNNGPSEVLQSAHVIRDRQIKNDNTLPISLITL